MAAGREQQDGKGHRDAPKWSNLLRSRIFLPLPLFQQLKRCFILYALPLRPACSFLLLLPLWARKGIFLYPASACLLAEGGCSFCCFCCCHLAPLGHPSTVSSFVQSANVLFICGQGLAAKFYLNMRSRQSATPPSTTWFCPGVRPLEIIPIRVYWYACVCEGVCAGAAAYF